MKLKLYNGKKKASLTNGADITGCQHVVMQIDPFLSLCTKLKSKRIKNRSIILTMLNLTEEKVRSNLQCVVIGDHFLNITPIAQTLRETINKWYLLKLL